MPILATDALVHFNTNLSGEILLFAVICSGVCWILQEIALKPSGKHYQLLVPLAPSTLLSLYLYSLHTGSFSHMLGISHVGGWTRYFSAEECLAAYILLAVSSILSLRVLRTPGHYFKTIGLIELTLTLAFGAREVYEIVREHF